MSLLLTKTCEYAILITIQQGKHFMKNTKIIVKSELDLKLPPSIDDLIPTSTVIQAPIVQTDDNGECSFNNTLVYYISFKQLQRLRKINSTIALSICQSTTTDKLLFSMADTKEVVYNQSSKKLDQIYQFVSDKGHWYKVVGQQKELKIGLFYVQMPDNNSSNSSNPANSFIHIRSPPPLPPTKALKKKKNLTTILGNSNNNNTNSISSMATPSMVTTTTATTAASSFTLEKPPLRRAKSSLVDLNIEELSDVLKKLNVFSSSSSSKKSAGEEETRPYHQIGKGKSKYTFYFQVTHVDHYNIRRMKRPFLSYTFLTKYTLLPTASFSSTRKSMPTNTSKKNHFSLNALQESSHCYYLRGHLVDIQDWLDHQKCIQLNYILMDSHTKEIVSQHNVSLENLAYNGGLADKTVLMMNENEKIATITFKIGLVSGWLDEYEEADVPSGNKRNSATINTQQKKMKSIPDISHTTRKPSIPSIRYIRPFKT